MEWVEFASGTVFREGIRKYYELAQQYAVRQILTNNSQMRAIRAGDQEWYVEEVMPQMLALGLKRVALVESMDAMNRMAIDGLLGIYQPHTYELARFHRVTDAWAWLLH